MSQEVLYRKWRPGTFDDVVGQEPIVTTLRNAVGAGTPAHAYLFTGPRGTGKTTTGRLLAKAVNCEAPVEGEPDNTCISCLAFSEGRALDLIELDAASNRGIDEVRTLRENVGVHPNAARYKLYLIDEVHMLTDAAFNALLKTLEEPPGHVIFVLATTEPHRIPPTISSRCQRFDFRRISIPAIIGRLTTIADGEGFTVEPAGLELIARQSGGSLRDAINLLDQLVAYHGRTLDVDAVQRGLGLVVDDRAAQLARAAVERDLPAGLALLGAVRDDGLEVRAFVREVVAALRNALLMRAGAGDTLHLSETQRAELAPIAEGSQAVDIVAALRALGEVDFAGDAYDALPAEIAFAAHASGLATAVEVSPAPSPATSQQPARESAPPRGERGERPQQRRAEGSAERPRRAPAPPQPRAEQTPEARPAGNAAPAPEAPRAQATRREPPPPVAPDHAPEGATASPELVRLREQWPSIREAARDRHYKAGALLNSRCYIKDIEGDTVEVGFQSSLLVEKATGDVEVLTAIREAIGDAVGRPVRVVPVVWSDLQPGAAPPPLEGGAQGGPPPIAAERGGGHLLDEARKLGAVPLDG